MSVLVRSILDSFWSSDIWLPPNVTWADLEPNDEVQYADYRHLFYPLPMAMLMLLLRFILEKYWFEPVGVLLGMKMTKLKRAPPNDLLEKAYKQNNKMKHRDVTAIAKQLDFSERQIERWLRLRRSQDKPSTLTKFCECSWRCFYYVYSFIYGVACLWDKPWLWDICECWVNYPHQSVTPSSWWYYMISLAYYWSLAVSQFFDVKRKDFWQMFVHHAATISLMSFAWVCNFHRVGTLTLMVHDLADIFLEAAKMAKYAKYQKICDTIFATFTVLWIVTRLGVFPFWIIYSTAIEAPRYADTMFPAYYIFNGLLMLLFMLDLYWTYLILKIAYNAIYAGKLRCAIWSTVMNRAPLESDDPTGYIGRFLSVLLPAPAPGCDAPFVR